MLHIHFRETAACQLGDYFHVINNPNRGNVLTQYFSIIYHYDCSLPGHVSQCELLSALATDYVGELCVVFLFKICKVYLS